MSATTYVLVPGAGGAASYWNLVRERLAAHGVPSTAVALPGPDPESGLPEYVDLIVRAAEPLDDVVLVGQSLGGFSASWAADLIGPRELVLINAMIPLPGETAGQWWDATGSDAARKLNDVREGRDPDAPFDLETYFTHDVAPEVVAALNEDAQDENEAVFEAPWGPRAWPEVPTRVLSGVDDRFFPFGFQQTVARDRLGLDVEAIPGGHLCALSRPDELTDALLRSS